MTLWRDLRYGARLLAQAPGFTALAVLVLALGIGATSTVFSLIDATLLRPLPYRAPHELVMLWEAPPDYAHNRVAPLNFADWSEQNHTFTSMTAVAGGGRTLTLPDGTPERLDGQAVTASFFDVLGIAPLAGRTFVASDATPGTHVAIISERLWHSHFGGDATLIGRAVPMDGEPVTIVGVMPASFQILFPADLWTVYAPGRGPEQRQMHYLQVIGRLKPGVTKAQAEADMAGIAAHIAAISPATNKGWGVTIDPLRESLVGDDLKTTSLVLGGIVGFVLLMACANVANLLLARGVGRTREIAVRAALGSGRGRILRQLVTESLLLAAIGGAAGLAVSAAAIRLAPSLMPEGTLPPGLTLALDFRVASFALLLTVGTGVVFGLAPAWHASEVPLSEALATGRTSASRRTRLLRSSLAVVEVAVAVVLLTGAGLLVRTLVALDAVDSGASAHNVLTMVVALPDSRYPTSARALQFYEAAEREIAALPGVRSVSFGGSLPLDGWDIGQGFSVVGDPAPDRANQPAAHYQITGPRFFQTLGIPLLRGRAFGTSDTASSPAVCIVSEAFVRRYARGRDPLQLQVQVDAMGPKGPTPVVRQIVGVARQVREMPGEESNEVQIYVPLAQNAWYWSTLAVQTAGTPVASLASIKAAIGRVDKAQAVMRVRTIDEIAAEATSRPRFRAQLVGVLAALALLLAAVGIAGVLAFSVQQRTRELGIRMALGARAADILRLVLGDGLRLTAVGLLAGLAGAAVLSRVLESLLFGVKALDALTFVVAPAVFVFAALVACGAPALRAARAEPATALRHE
jgi:putative ABC transport system permease protein